VCARAPFSADKDRFNQSVLFVYLLELTLANLTPYQDMTFGLL
jgi:hypothetical protein